MQFDAKITKIAGDRDYYHVLDANGKAVCRCPIPKDAFIIRGVYPQAGAWCSQSSIHIADLKKRWRQMTGIEDGAAVRVYDYGEEDDEEDEREEVPDQIQGSLL